MASVFSFFSQNTADGLHLFSHDRAKEKGKSDVDQTRYVKEVAPSREIASRDRIAANSSMRCGSRVRAAAHEQQLHVDGVGATHEGLQRRHHERASRGPVETRE